MSRFAERALVHDEAREQAVRHVLHEVSARGIERIRVNAADAHGQLRGKTLTPRALESALRDGIGFVSTLLLKDSSDRTAYAVFEPGGADALGQGFACAANLVLLPDPASLTLLPWSPGTAMLRGQLWHGDGRPVAIDTRRVLQAALARLAGRGLALRCGLEVEFHIYRLLDARLDPAQADWPGPAPEVARMAAPREERAAAPGQDTPAPSAAPDAPPRAVANKQMAGEPLSIPQPPSPPSPGAVRRPAGR